MPLDKASLGAALNETLTLHSSLCRREAAGFVQALGTGEDLVVACTQESRLFTELASQTPGAQAPIRFVNIRETGAGAVTPKTPAPRSQPCWPWPT